MVYRFLLLIVFSMIACAVNAQTATWDYPVKPGMDEWNQLKTEHSGVEFTMY